MLRSLALMAAILAFFASVVGGVGLRLVESSAVREIQRDPVLSQLNDEADPKVAAFRAEIVQRALMTADEMKTTR
jgi:hypothetical protein